ncbi:MAG: hypothetical protein HRT90_02605 [Candidatus Margulisbacteria bacterium]|nr:hypothetical protein [Candidatus Margulisiibacteriota bacterium]
MSGIIIPRTPLRRIVSAAPKLSSVLKRNKIHSWSKTSGSKRYSAVYTFKSKQGGTIDSTTKCEGKGTLVKIVTDRTSGNIKKTTLIGTFKKGKLQGKGKETVKISSAKGTKIKKTVMSGKFIKGEISTEEFDGEHTLKTYNENGKKTVHSNYTGKFKNGIKSNGKLILVEQDTNGDGYIDLKFTGTFSKNKLKTGNLLLGEATKPSQNKSIERTDYSDIYIEGFGKPNVTNKHNKKNQIRILNKFNHL